MTHPFLWLQPPSQKRLLALLTVALLGLSGWLLTLDQALVNEQTPQGIVSFELAGSQAKAERILQSWSPSAREQAMFIQGLDNLYLLVYPGWLALSLSLLAAPLSERPRAIGYLLAWLILLAIPLDLVENYALLQQLRGGASAHWAQLALICAAPKFGLVLVGFGGVIVLGTTNILRRLTSR